jgi:hypothetical protein
VCYMLPKCPPRSYFGPIHVILLRIPFVYIVSSYRDTTTIIILCLTARHDLVFIAHTATRYDALRTPAVKGVAGLVVQIGATFCNR